MDPETLKQIGEEAKKLDQPYNRVHYSLAHRGFPCLLFGRLGPALRILFKDAPPEDIKEFMQTAWDLSAKDAGVFTPQPCEGLSCEKPQWTLDGGGQVILVKMPKHDCSNLASYCLMVIPDDKAPRYFVMEKTNPMSGLPDYLLGEWSYSATQVQHKSYRVFFKADDKEGFIAKAMAIVGGEEAPVMSSSSSSIPTKEQQPNLN